MQQNFVIPPFHFFAVAFSSIVCRMKTGVFLRIRHVAYNSIITTCVSEKRNV